MLWEVFKWNGMNSYESILSTQKTSPQDSVLSECTFKSKVFDDIPFAVCLDVFDSSEGVVVSQWYSNITSGNVFSLLDHGVETYTRASGCCARVLRTVRDECFIIAYINSWSIHHCIHPSNHLSTQPFIHPSVHSSINTCTLKCAGICYFLIAKYDTKMSGNGQIQFVLSTMIQSSCNCIITGKHSHSQVHAREHTHTYTHKHHTTHTHKHTLPPLPTCACTHTDT